jgi:hypothetical protein
VLFHTGNCHNAARRPQAKGNFSSPLRLSSSTSESFSGIRL